MQKLPSVGTFHFEPPSLVSLFDRLVGAGEQCRRDFDAERSRGRKVDHEFELARLDDRQISWLGALEDSDGIDGDLAKRLHEARPVTHQAARFRILACIIDGGNAVSWSRRLKKKESVPATSASARLRTRDANAASISRMLLA